MSLNFILFANDVIVTLVPDFVISKKIRKVRKKPARVGRASGEEAEQGEDGGRGRATNPELIRRDLS